MLDQSFSASNFRTIYDLENRKGSFFESKDMFKDDVFELSRSKTNEIKNIIGSIKKIRRARDSKTISQKSAVSAPLLPSVIPATKPAAGSGKTD